MEEGLVTEFDEVRGWGGVESNEVSYPFHCTQIADGTSTIEVGTEVTFEVRAGVMGSWEGTTITKLA